MGGLNRSLVSDDPSNRRQDRSYRFYGDKAVIKRDTYRCERPSPSEMHRDGDLSKIGPVKS